jgi:uncharacterized protein (DUF1501 family)
MTQHASRREFLKRAGALSVTGVGGPLAMNLAAMSEAAAANAIGYKALVCVFLYGGNDYANTLVTADPTNHALYTAQRPAIATPLDALARTMLVPTTALADGRQYALAPQLAGLLPSFNAGKMAVMLNIGTLNEPTTKKQYVDGTGRLPAKLFSHNDQQSTYQSEGPEGSTTGWGGRIADLFAAGNGQSIFTCIGMSGNSVFLSGNSAIAYQMSPSAKNGVVPFNGLASPLFGSAACSSALRDLITAASVPRTNLFEAAHAAIARRSIAAAGVLDTTLAGFPTSSRFPAGNNLAAQLGLVARMIAARDVLKPKRQVFFVSIGGFDNHDGMLTDHADRLDEVNEALSAFQAEMAALAVENSVTTFTASDFGRTLNSDGDGADHGWGSMHFVLGGAVKGREFYGKAPVTANNGPDDVGRGRLLPTMAVDQFGATLGKWFGVSDTELLAIYPNLANFTTRDVQFMKAG